MLLTMIKGERRRTQVIGNENEQRSKKRSKESYKKWTKERKEEQSLLRMNKGERRVIVDEDELNCSPRRSKTKE